MIRAFVPRTAGFFEIAPVSASVSARQKGGSGPSVSASKNSVPDSDVRDRFDDWVVGLQFVPDYLHHPVLGCRPSQAVPRLVRRNRGIRASRASLSLFLLGDEQTFAVPSLRRDFPFPGGQVFGAKSAAFAPAKSTIL